MQDPVSLTHFWSNWMWRMTLYNNDGNRTEWSPIQSVIIRVINKIEWPPDLSWVWLQTELDNTKSYYQLIITAIISENNKINTCSRDNVYVKKFLNFFRISGCCYGYCEQFCDWWIWLFSIITTRKIHLTINSFLRWWLFPLLLRPQCLFQGGYCKVKLMLASLWGKEFTPRSY